MELDVTMQPHDESIRTKTNQDTKNNTEHDFKQVINQEPSLVQETFTPTKQVNNMLPIGTEPIRPL